MYLDFLEKVPDAPGKLVRFKKGILPTLTTSMIAFMIGKRNIAFRNALQSESNQKKMQLLCAQIRTS